MLKPLLVGLLILSFQFSLFAQGEMVSTTNEEAIPNDLLINGTLYYSLHPRANGSPYYPVEDWTLGTVFIQGEPFEVETLRFDLEQNGLILQHFVKGLGLTPIDLNKNLVDSFYLADQRFVNSRVYNSELEAVYYQKIYAGDFDFLIRRKKTFIDDFSQQNPRGKYSSLRSTYFIVKEGTITKLDNERALKKYFKDESGAIKKYLKTQSFYFNGASDQQLIDLMKFCDELF